MSLCGSDADVCSSALLIPAILGCGRTEPPLNPMSEFAEPALGVDYAQPRPQLGPLDRLPPLVAWRHRELQHLPYRLPRKPELPGYRSLTPALNTNRTTHTSVYLHLRSEEHT